MAASVDNRQFMDPSSVNNGPALLRPIKPGPILRHLEPPPRLVNESFSDDDHDGDEDDDYSSYIEEIIFKSREGGLEPSLLDPRDESTADNWIERHPSMVRLTGKHPFNAEAPIDHLMRHGFITPIPLHYVRNHGYVPKGTWHEWTVEVAGLVKHPRVFTLDQLVSEFPSRELPVTLVCAGNRRREQNMMKQTKGFNWGAAGVSTSVWRGVPLHAVLKRCGILKPSRGALNVCFEGAEDLPGGGGSKYGTSLPRGVAMDPTRDIIIAYMQNGERLKPDHGFPLRMIIPGHIGGRMVKWLKRIVVTPIESDNFYHYKDNRVLPSHVDQELADEQGWWYKPEHIINELNINSIITTPCHEELLPVSTWTIQKAYTLKGYAYSGGGRKVTRVEVTLDGGETWRMCELDHPERPTPHGKYWCWCFWRCEVEVLELVVTKEIAVRAWDESHNTQPEKLIWNLMGMMNNCWFRVKANVCRPHQGEIGIVFEHPTVPGNQQGGWMAKQKQSGSENQTLKRSVSTPIMVTSSDKFPMSVVEAHNSPESPWIIVHGHVYDCTRFLKDHPGGSDSILINAGTDCTEEFDAIHSDKAKALLEDYRIGELQTTSDSTPIMVTSSEKFPMSVVKAHNSPESPWIIVHGHVYDCTRFLKDHPGGADSIIINAGTDCTDKFDAIHSDKAKALLEDYLIGELLTTSDSTISSPNSSVHGVSNFTHLPPITEDAPVPACSVALIPREKIRCKLVKKTILSHDVRIFRFALPSEDQVLGLPVGKHVFLCATIDGKLCMRAYTPTSDIDEVGHFDLLIKVYFKNAHPDYPNGGLMSQYLESLPLHSVIEVKGPLGHIEYVGRGKFLVHGKPRLTTKLAMIAGGTGITPIYQVIQAVMKDPTDRTEMYVVYANRTEDDILLGEQLDEWSRNDERLKVWYVMSKSIRGGWNYSLGRINEEIMREHLPQGSDDTLALACGPPGMIQSTVKPILEMMKYNVKDSFLVF